MVRATRIAPVLAVSLVVTLAFVGTAPEAGARTLRRTHMLQLINAAREDRGRVDLRLNRKLSWYAKRHSRRMAEKGYIFHTRSLSSRLSNVSWSVAGENVGAGGSVDTLFQAFMASDPHRRNILLGSYRHVGVGMVRRDGYLWVTMVFYG
ncbi:MAG: CAP domain-containing protein [Actinobacteria bacterium]|nr:CAP domain-containing protein [Actinomycetota bacterium]